MRQTYGEMASLGGSLGDAVVNPGTPLGMSKTVSVDAGSNPMSVFSMVKADNMDAALDMAKGCPYLDMDTATIEVAKLMEM